MQKLIKLLSERQFSSQHKVDNDFQQSHYENFIHTKFVTMLIFWHNKLLVKFKKLKSDRCTIVHTAHNKQKNHNLIKCQR